MTTMQAAGAVMELCHVTRDMDRALAHWTQVLGAGPFYVFDVPAQPGQRHRGQPTQVDLRIAFGFSGGLLIELVQQLNDTPSVFTEMLDAHGEGYHHVMLRLSFDEGAQRFARHGFAPAFEGTLPSGERYALYDMRAANGGFVELMDLTPTTLAPMEKIHQAHLAWDGHTAPRRDFSSLF